MDRREFLTNAALGGLGLGLAPGLLSGEAKAPQDAPNIIFLGGEQTPYQGQSYIVDEYGGTFWLPSYEHKSPKGNGRAHWGYGKSADEVTERIGKLTEQLLNNPNIAGFCYTELTDVEQEVNGIYTYGRELKFDAKKLRQIFGAPAAIEQKVRH